MEVIEKIKDFLTFNKEDKTYTFRPITVPTSWNELKLGQYQELSRYLKTLKEEETPDYTKIVSILTNEKEDEINLLPLEFMTKIISHISFLNKTPEVEPSNKVEINGETYYISNMEDLRFGEWVDVQELIKDNTEDYASIFAILCRKSGELYNQEYINKEYENRVKMFENLNMIDTLKLSTFFLTLLALSRKPSQLYTENLEEEVKYLVKDTENMLKNGDYVPLYTNWQKRKLKKLKKSLNKILPKP